MLNRTDARAALFEDGADDRGLATSLGEKRSGIGMRLLAWCRSRTTDTSSCGRVRAAISAASCAA